MIYNRKFCLDILLFSHVVTYSIEILNNNSINVKLNIKLLIVVEWTNWLTLYYFRLEIQFFGNLANILIKCYYNKELFLFGVKDSIRLNFSS